jgi:hypothetical protein
VGRVVVVVMGLEERVEVLVVLVVVVVEGVGSLGRG